MHPLTIAQTIIHEALHSYLKAKKFQCSSGTTISELNYQELDELLNEFDYSCIANATNEHDIMFNVLVPKMSQMLSEIYTQLVASDELSPILYFYPPPTEEQETFNWQDCFFNMSLVGLGEAYAFSTISGDARKNYFFNQYNLRMNDPLIFTQSTCEE